MIQADIEAALRRDLDDEHAWGVYGDLLALEGDAHGELIALEQRAAASPDGSFQQRELLHRAELLVERERRAWLGPLADAGLELTWTRGFITEATIARHHAKQLGELLELPVAALLRSLAFVRPRSVDKLVAQLGAWPLERLELRATLDDSLAPLAALSTLRELCVDGGSTRELELLATLEGLQRLELARFEGPLTSLAQGFDALRELALTAPSSAGVLRALPADALAPLAKLTQLRTLDIHDGGWSELAPLAGLTQLRRLDIRSTNIVSLAPLAGLTQLRELDAGGCANISDLRPLASLAALEQLGLRYTRVQDLRPLAGLAKLTSVDLSGTPVRDPSPLADCPALRRVNLEACEPDDIRPLLAREIRVLGVRAPAPSWRELAEDLLRGGR